MIIALGMVIGIIYGLYFKISIAIFIAILLNIAIISMKNKKVFFFLARRRRIIILLIICSICSNTYINLLNKKYDKFYETIKEKIEVEAVVISDAEETDYYNSYKVKSGNKKFILYISKKDKQKLEYGMLIKIKGVFSEPEEQRNYKGFDYKQYLKSKKIYGSIKSENIEILARNKINIISKSSNQVRNRIITIAKEILPENTQGLLTGILIGAKSEIQDKTSESFRNSSLSHILAISGTHITYIIMGISYLLVKSKIPKRISYFIIDLILIFFMFITGFTPSVVRASIMGIILISSKLLYRKPDVLTSISATIIIILIYNPFSIQDIGLQLSYLGTIGIILLNKPVKKFLIKKIPEKISEVMAVTISAQILIMPITALNYNTISLTFLISNIIAVPLAGIIILYGYVNIFIGIFFTKIAKIMGIILNILLKLLILIATIVSKLPFSNIIISTPNIIYVIIYYFLVFANKKTRKLLLILLLIIIAINSIYKIFPHELKIHIIDVGQRR